MMIAGVFIPYARVVHKSAESRRHFRIVSREDFGVMLMESKSRMKCDVIKKRTSSPMKRGGNVVVRLYSYFIRKNTHALNLEFE
jgi:hypothetical protein